MQLGRYEIVAQLAVGGMGRVSLARSTGEGGFERHVVIKSLDAVDGGDAEATAMFLDEARILGMLHHQHIAAIQEVGRDADGRLFLVLEYVHGHSAHDVWERALDLEIHLPLDFTLTLIAAAASGLHYAHTKRSADGERLHIVHRDVTLSNLMIGFDGAVKVIDFGIAKAALRETKTKSGFIKGKLGYMAPEQLRGQHLDARTDVFSLGIVLYELTTMKRAFREISDRETVERIKAGRYTRPSEIVPDYPPALEAIVMKALKVDPKHRYADADEMRIAVEGLGHELRLVVGDAAVVDTMMRLFPNRAEPWQRRATTRAETESAIEVEWDDPHIGITREAPPGALKALLAEPTSPARLVTEPAEELVVDSQVTNRIATNPAEGSLRPRGQHLEPMETTGEVLAPPTFLEPERRSESETDEADLGAVISSLDLAPKTARTATAFPDEPTPLPLPVPPPEEDEPRTPFEQKHQQTAYIRAQKPPSRSPMWLFVGTLIVAVSVAAAVLLYLYEQKQKEQEAAPPATSPPPTTAANIAPMRPDGVSTAPDAGAGSGSGSASPPADAGAGSAVAPAPGAVHVRITSTPPDATVLLDGVRLGHTPFDGDMPLEPGDHVIKIRLPRYSAQKRTIQITGDGIDETFTLLRTN
ncbi:MAG: serine/threonine-protein kinase [Polyangiales bacterium]